MLISGILDSRLDAGGGFVGNPVRAALRTDGRGHLPDYHHAEAKVGSKSGRPWLLFPSAEWANIRLLIFHGYFFTMACCDGTLPPPE